MTRSVSPERTGWRDRALSERHRIWGWDCPAVDIDFLMLEYDHCKAVALVEYKHEQAKEQRKSNPSIKALIDLGNRANVSVFCVRYANDFSWWRVVPLNKVAQGWLSDRDEMTETDWVRLLYRMRGYDKVPDDVRFTLA